jgi:hypothetical protein
MSIVARISKVDYQPDGTAKLRLVPIPGCDDPVGQPSLTVLNPPPAPQLQVAVGCDIWGGSGSIIMGRETKWADRVGYTAIRLVPKK